jgi:hypothetical protein
MYGEMFTDAEASANSGAAPIAPGLLALCVHAVAAGVPLRRVVAGAATSRKKAGRGQLRRRARREPLVPLVISEG